MAYCHQCGEQVAENDVFCPYCGISLQPIAVGGEDISLDKTIIASQPVIFESTENKDSADALETAEAEPFENSNVKTDEYSGSIAEENIDLKTDEVEIPAEASENEEIAPEASANENYTAQTPPENETEISKPDFLQENEADSEIPLPENIEILKPIVEPPKIEEAEDEPAEAAQFEEIYAETAEPTNEEIYAQSMDSVAEDENILIEEPSVSSNNADTPEPEAEEAETLLSSANISKEEYLPELNEEIQPRAESSQEEEEAISKPEFDLEPVQKSSSASVFDSVQIVQKEEKDEPVEAKPVETEASQPEQPPEQKEGRSFTTPNITGGDTDGKSQSKLKPLDEGTVLNNRYEIVRKIGGGGMGAVYLASDKNLGGVLRAVKEMVQSYIEETQQEKAVADFKRESMLLTSLEHQAIPTIFDYFYDEQEQRFYLVMKYISGGDLASRLRSSPDGRIDEQTVTEWAIQVADVLDYLHNRQPPIVYRDLKPANIMIDGNSGRIMLIDFGIARWINKEEKGVTAVGTMGYAPPELFSGNVESRSDIYSLGSTMFHFLTGADPQSNPLLIFDFQKNPRPRQINPQLSDQIERILMRSVEYNSDKRFASAKEMRDALQEHLDNLKASRVTFGVKEVPASVALSDQPVFCGFCGQKIVATDMFCAFCGAKQPIAQQGVHYGDHSMQNMTAKLMILGTNDLESPSFYLEKDENLVGRRDPMSNIFPEIDLSKFDPQTKISRRHARIWREGASFMVEDLGSSNGTVLLPVVNETIRLLPHQPHVLTNGDKLKIGDTTMHFVIG
jgi:serine/threonine protein kinase